MRKPRWDTVVFSEGKTPFFPPYEGAGVWALTNALAILQPSMMNLLEGAGVWALTNALAILQPSMTVSGKTGIRITRTSCICFFPKGKLPCVFVASWL
jgi:hypothetical protein